MSTEANKALIRRHFAEIWNQRQLHVADELVAQGIPCITAESGEQALALLVTRPTIGLLITELHMQCGSGLELVRQVRQSAQPSLPVIIISAICTYSAPTR